MSDASDLAGEAASPDPTVGLRAALALRKLAEALERLQVDNARRQGWSWQDIAAALQVSKQAVHKRYSAGSPAPSAPPATRPQPAQPARVSAEPVAAQPDPVTDRLSIPDPVEG